MGRTLAALAVLAAAVATLAGSAGAITGNYVDDFEHPYVGLLVFYTNTDPVSPTNDPFSHRCSGSLLTPTVVLTAGHCTDGIQDGRIYMAQSVAPNYDPNAFFGHGGDPTTGYPYTSGVTFSTTFDYGFDEFAGFPNTRDAGLVILDEPIALPEYGKLAVPGSLDRYVKTQRKQEVIFTPSGYGLSYSSPVRTESFRERLMARSSLINLGSHNNAGFNLQTTANPGGGKGGTCSGDSGGPVFHGGFTSDTIVAVTSFGMNPWCRGVDFSYRTDQQAVVDWIEDSLVEALGPAAGAAEFDKIQFVEL